jgi:hypothetical protein
VARQRRHEVYGRVRKSTMRIAVVTTSSNARAGWVIVRINCSGKKGRRHRAEGGRGKEINVQTVCRRPQLGRPPHPSGAFSFPLGTCVGTKDPCDTSYQKWEKLEER